MANKKNVFILFLKVVIKILKFIILSCYKLVFFISFMLEKSSNFNNFINKILKKGEKISCIKISKAL